MCDIAWLETIKTYIRNPVWKLIDLAKLLTRNNDFVKQYCTLIIINIVLKGVIAKGHSWLIT